MATVNANGLVIALVGVWVVVQVFGGDALRRLRIIATPVATQ